MARRGNGEYGGCPRQECGAGSGHSKEGGWGRGDEGKQKRRWHGHMDSQLLSQLKRSAFHFNPGSAVMVP